jgi:hypothetical protein
LQDPDQSTGEAYFSKRQDFTMLKHRCAALLTFTMLKHRYAALLIFTMPKHRCAAMLIFTMLKHRCADFHCLGIFHDAETPLFSTFHFFPFPKTLQSVVSSSFFISETTPSSTCFAFLPSVAETSLPATFHFSPFHC